MNILIQNPTEETVINWFKSDTFKNQNKSYLLIFDNYSYLKEKLLS